MVLIEYAHGVLVEYVRCKHFPCVVCDFPGHQLSLIYFHSFSRYSFVFIVWYCALNQSQKNKKELVLLYSQLPDIGIILSWQRSHAFLNLNEIGKSPQNLDSTSFLVCFAFLLLLLLNWTHRSLLCGEKLDISPFR